MDKIEKIRQEIERQIEEEKNNLTEETELYYGARQQVRSKLLSFLDTLSEELDKSLEAEIQRYLREECSSDDEPTVSEIAYHFAEWQYQKDRGEFAKIKAKTWCEGFDAYKEQMLKDVYVESQIVEDGRIELEGEPLPCLNPIILLPYPQFKPDDKVRIIIIKED